MRPHSFSPSLYAVLSFPLLAGCPVEVDHAAAQRSAAAPAPIVEADEKDPRVVRDGEDLYAADAHAKGEAEADAPRGLGSGKPDESNGYCRLYAPKLPEPECCKVDSGFDAAVATEACGHQLYLGESFQFSCGYFFHDVAGGAPSWMRTSFVEEATPKEAGERHLRRLKDRLKVDAEIRPVQGVPGAYWSTYEGLAWAWIPGWEKVRQLAWREESCSPEGISTVVKSMVEARHPDPRQPRASLIPQALK